ncbi:MAG: hypothetical protein ABGF52_06530 [Candidatus Asgardarchaeum sp.]
MFVNSVFASIIRFVGMELYLSVESAPPPPGEPAPPMYYFLYIIVPLYVIIITVLFVLPILWPKIKKNLRRSLLMMILAMLIYYAMATVYLYVNYNILFFP